MVSRRKVQSSCSGCGAAMITHASTTHVMNNPDPKQLDSASSTSGLAPAYHGTRGHRVSAAVAAGGRMGAGGVDRESSCGHESSTNSGTAVRRRG
jgi:hypothetical protein